VTLVTDFGRSSIDVIAISPKIPLHWGLAGDHWCKRLYSSTESNLVFRSELERSPVRYEYDLAGYPSFAQQLVGLSSRDKWKSLCDQWLYLLLLKEIKEGD